MDGFRDHLPQLPAESLSLPLGSHRTGPNDSSKPTLAATSASPGELNSSGDDPSRLRTDRSTIEYVATTSRGVAVDPTGTFEEAATRESPTRPIHTNRTSTSTKKTTMPFVEPIESPTSSTRFEPSTLPNLSTTPQIQSTRSRFTLTSPAVIVTPSDTDTITATTIASSTETSSSAIAPGASPEVTRTPAANGQTLTNGATAGIVLASVASIIALGLGLWMLYKRKMRSRLLSPFGLSPIMEPYDASHPSAAVGKPTLPTDLNSWTMHHCSDTGVTPSPYGLSSPRFASQPDSVEMMSFTRPVRGPRKVDIGDQSTMAEAPANQLRHNNMPQSFYHSPQSGQTGF